MLLSVPSYQIPLEPVLIMVVALAVTQMAGLRAALAATAFAAVLVLVARHDIAFKQRAGAFRQRANYAATGIGIVGRIRLENRRAYNAGRLAGESALLDRASDAGRQCFRNRRA